MVSVRGLLPDRGSMNGFKIGWKAREAIRLEDNNRWLEGNQADCGSIFHAKYFRDNGAPQRPSNLHSGRLIAVPSSSLYLYNLR